MHRAFDSEEPSGAKQANGESQSAKKPTPSASVPGSMLRCLVIDLPLMLLFAALALAALLRHSYHTYVMPMVESHRHGDWIHDDMFNQKFHNEFTYYNRQCDAQDISTTDSADLLIHEHYSGRQAADVMLEHGAVAFRDVLDNATATELRAYLASRHEVYRRGELGWNEKFWDGENGSRLSLGLGVADHPAIARALQQIGRNAVLKRSLEAILGPDPAIVEFSTLTTLQGAEDQGIHSDSDWFGSSLLYGRTFLHSYSLFVALQDTDKDLGATTVCPGSHFCANEDLIDVCLENGAFEVSSNGLTGKHGLLATGDAFLFNQNIWHRGPTNCKHPSKDRVMFILTFASRNRDTPGDYRVQGLGTYYYQRWNNWGHTFNDLKDAARTLQQPLAGMQALGLWKPRKRHWGITWIEQFVRQLANKEDFYSNYELREFKSYLGQLRFPMELRSDAKGWEKFIRETMDLWLEKLSLANGVAVGVYLTLRLIGRFIFKRKSTESRGFVPGFIKRIVLTHGAVCLVAYLLLLHIDETPLAQSVKSGKIFTRPFPSETDGENSLATPLPLGPTTLPERNDVLISTRLDSEFLASFARFIDFHPGNRHWKSMVTKAAPLPPALQSAAVKTIVKTILDEKHAGVRGRFLLQDPSTGAWTILPESSALEETQKLLKMEQSELVEALSRHLSSVLADARFGAKRGSAMARKFVPLVVEEWRRVLFHSGEASNCHAKDSIEEQVRRSSFALSRASRFDLVSPQLRDATVTAKAREEYYSKQLGRSATAAVLVDDNVVQVFDRVFAKYGTSGRWVEAKVIEVYDDSTCLVAYTEDLFDTLSARDIRIYEPFKEGDVVEVDHRKKSRKWRQGRIVSVHPDGTYTVRYRDGGIDNIFSTTVMRQPHSPAVTVKGTTVFSYVVGSRIEGNYLGKGRWFPGEIAAVNEDGTYDISYDDGDEESQVMRHHIRNPKL